MYQTLKSTALLWKLNLDEIEVLNLEFNGHLSNFAVKQKRQLLMSYPRDIKTLFAALTAKNVQIFILFSISLGLLSIGLVESFVKISQKHINILPG